MPQSRGRRSGSAGRRRRLPLIVALAVAVIALIAGGAVLAGRGDGDDLDGVGMSTSIDLEATEMRYSSSALVVPADVPLPVRLVNKGVVVHDLRIEGQPFLLEARPGEADEGQVTLRPGRYRVFCSLPGHAQAGMELKLRAVAI